MRAEREYFAWLVPDVPGLSPVDRRHESTRETAVVPSVPAVPGAIEQADTQTASIAAGCRAADGQAFRGKRAVIGERDGHLSGPAAEAMAYQHCIAEYLNQHPATSPPGRCAACGETEAPGAVVVPFGIDTAGHAWLHPECWPAWDKARRAGAAVALGDYGLHPGGQRNE